MGALNTKANAAVLTALLIMAACDGSRPDAGVDAGARTTAGHTWYVATDGDDAGPGTSAQPFATWQRGIDAARPGDEVLIRGGVYAVSGFRYAGVTVYRNGTAQRPITLRAEDAAHRPVLDCSGLDYSGGLTCLYVRADWWRVHDVEITGTPQPTPDTPSAVLLDDASHNVLRNVASHHNHGTGIRIAGASRYNLLRDCDAYFNADPGTTPDPYGNADGIAVAFLAPGAVGNRVVDCRAWWNSDDGFDLWMAEAPVAITGAWAFRNGFIPGTPTPAGNGQGFKLGRNDGGPRHTLTRCLAFENRAFGFDENGATGPLLLRNNTALRNGAGGFGFYNPVAHVLRNNVALPEGVNVDPAVDDASNAWTLPVTVGLRDFLSVSPAGADGPRAPDGSLPRLDFLRLRAGSDLIDAGTDVGLSFVGAAPDLGAYEYGATEVVGRLD